MECAADDALFVVEVPDTDIMLQNSRFDQVFHYHVHYFNLSSMHEFARRIGGTYVGHEYDYGNWGGSLLYAFRKTPVGDETELQASESVRHKPERIGKQHEIYCRRMKSLMDVLRFVDGEIWGYGAGQMVPSVAYNLGSDMSFLCGILDDNPDRAGLRYPELDVNILSSESVELESATVVVTALDGVRAIVPQLIKRKARKIIIPSDIL